MIRRYILIISIVFVFIIIMQSLLNQNKIEHLKKNIKNIYFIIALSLILIIIEFFHKNGYKNETYTPATFNEKGELIEAEIGK